MNKGCIIGVDFSINSTAVTIYKDNEFLIYSFVPNYNQDLKKFKIHRLISDTCKYAKIVSYDKIESFDDYSNEQVIKLNNANNLANTIINTIKPHIKDNIITINFEGFSYGSSGSSFIDLIVYNTILKNKLLNEITDNINIISPKSLKKVYTGSGNASKCDMIKAFINSNKLLEFQSVITNSIKSLEGEFKIPKPIDDVIDSLALSVYVKAIKEIKAPKKSKLKESIESSKP